MKEIQHQLPTIISHPPLPQVETDSVVQAAEVGASLHPLPESGMPTHEFSR